MPSHDFSFDWCIAPVSPETFFADHYEKAPLRIARDDAAYYGGLLSFDDIDHVVTTMGLSVPEIAVTRAAGDITPADYAYESGVIDPVRVNQLFADGATVILSGLHERLPRLAAFCRALEAVFSARVQTNIYMTQAQSQGFRAHYDDHDVLVLQVAGTKEWRFYDTPVELPLTSQAFDPSQVQVGPETERFVLQPGDMLYVPRGLAHDAVATGEPSLHITTGLMCRTWADVLVEAVNVMAHDDPTLRRALPPGYANRGYDMTRHQEDFVAMLNLIAEKAPLAKLMEGFKQDFLTGRVPRAHGQMAEMNKIKDLGPDSHVSARPHLIHDLTADEAEGTVRLICQGAEIELPDFARATLEAAITARDIRVSDLPGELDDAGKVVLVRRLVREGLMVIH